MSSEPLHPAARETLLAALDRGWADPLRLHRAGREARLLLDNAREVIGTLLGARPDEVSLTSSGTSAVHLGLLGLLVGRSRVSSRLVHSAVEHSAVLAAGVWWARTSSGPTSAVDVDHDGRVSIEALSAALGSPAGVVAVQAANPEVGTLQPLTSVAAELAEHDVPLFSDLCAAAGRVEVPSVWTAAAASAHKWGGPAGVGVLLVRHGARWRAPFPTDDRVDARTAGFENVPSALAAAAALQAMVEERAELAARQHALVDLVRRSAAAIEDVEVVGDAHERLPHVVTFSCLYVDGEALVTELDRHGFAVASGSACTASTLEPSHVLAAMGVLTHGNVRVSLTRDTTEDDVRRFVEVLPRVVADLRARQR